MEFEGVMLRKEIKLDLTLLQSEMPQRLFPHFTLSPNALVDDFLALSCLVQQVRRDKTHEPGHAQPSGVELLALSSKQRDVHTRTRHTI